MEGMRILTEPNEEPKSLLSLITIAVVKEQAGFSRAGCIELWGQVFSA